MDKWNNRNSYDWLAGGGRWTAYRVLHRSCGCEVRPVIFSVDVFRNLK